MFTPDPYSSQYMLIFCKRPNNLPYFSKFWFHWLPTQLKTQTKAFTSWLCRLYLLRPWALGPGSSPPSFSLPYQWLPPYCPTGLHAVPPHTASKLCTCHALFLGQYFPSMISAADASGKPFMNIPKVAPFFNCFQLTFQINHCTDAM